MQFNLKRIEDCFVWLENEFSSTDEFKVQNVNVLIDRLNNLCNTLPYINSMMALSKKYLNEAKVKAYYNLTTSFAANEQYYAPSLAKDFVAAKCSNEQYAFDLTERCSRTITHLIDALRTCISALKEERRVSSYAN